MFTGVVSRGNDVSVEESHCLKDGELVKRLGLVIPRIIIGLRAE